MILLFDVVSDIVYVSFVEWSHFIYFVESRMFCDPIVSLHLHFNYQSYYFKYMFKKKNQRKTKMKTKKTGKKKQDVHDKTNLSKTWRSLSGYFFLLQWLATFFTVVYWLLFDYNK